MIDDKQKNVQMSVLNDRTQAGSVHQKGRIELIINRRIFTEENFGVQETLNEIDNFGNGLNVSAKFYLSFTKSKYDAF